jgi:hypothetical protein
MYYRDTHSMYTRQGTWKHVDTYEIPMLINSMITSILPVIFEHPRMVCPFKIKWYWLRIIMRHNPSVY